MNGSEDSLQFSVLTPEERERREVFRQKISTIFQEDTLYRLLEDKGWTDRIFEGDILAAREEQSYNTQKAVELLGLKDQQDIRNTFRHLKHYIRPDESTGQNRFDYKAIIRLRMIFLLKGEYTIPAIERMISPIGKAAAVQSSSDGILLKLEEQEKKIEFFGLMLKQLMENITIQNNMLQLRDINESDLKDKLEQQGQLLMEIQQKIGTMEQIGLKNAELMLENQQDLKKLSEPPEDNKREIDFMNKWTTISRLRREAIIEWQKKPKEERFTKGWFGKEDINKRDIFIEEYIEQRERDSE